MHSGSAFVFHLYETMSSLSLVDGEERRNRFDLWQQIFMTKTFSGTKPFSWWIYLSSLLFCLPCCLSKMQNKLGQLKTTYGSWIYVLEWKNEIWIIFNGFDWCFCRHKNPISISEATWAENFMKGVCLASTIKEQNWDYKIS